MRQADGLTNDVIHQARQQACKVYLAPEMLVSNDTTPTAPGDVYSYAILLVEIATRVDPYSVSVSSDLNIINISLLYGHYRKIWLLMGSDRSSPT